MTVGYLLGAFDMLNVGDLDLIKQARALTSRVVLVVYTDEHVAATTGRRPVVPLRERLAVLEHIRGVDEVTVLEPGSAPNGLIFAAEGDLGAPQDVRRLSGRQSASAMLRDALSGRVAGSESVA